MEGNNPNKEVRSIRVLVVDDDTTFSAAVRTTLQLFRPNLFNVTIKDSVESAFEELSNNKDFDLILLDYYFPTSNGLELCLQLDQLDYRIPIIFLTSASDFKLAVEAMKLGVEDFLLKKDIDKTNLPRTILNILDRVRIRKHKQAVEKRLAMAENRAQAIRELVVTVCHEFNNPLAAVKISFDLLHRNELDEKSKEIMQLFEQQFNRIDSEIKRLRDLNFEKFDFHDQLKFED
jgi:FixJ family two-component response regulator